MNSSRSRSVETRPATMPAQPVARLREIVGRCRRAKSLEQGARRDEVGAVGPLGELRASSAAAIAPVVVAGVVERSGAGEQGAVIREHRRGGGNAQRQRQDQQHGGP